MLNPLVDTRDVKFVIFELLEVDKMTKYPAFAEFDHDTFEATIDLAEQMAVEVFNVQCKLMMLFKMNFQIPIYHFN